MRLFAKIILIAASWLCALMLSPAVAATLTEQIGTAGGTSFEVTCPAGQVMVGIDYRSDDNIMALAGICKKVGSNGMVTGKIYGTDGYGGDVTTGRPRPQILCRQDAVIDGLSVAIDHRHLVRLLQVHCAPSVGTGEGIYVGTTLVGHQAPNQVEYSDAIRNCRFAIGFAGAQAPGGTIQRLGLKCEPIAGPDGAPIDIDNGRSTARVDTTIYDQPQGNDVAYLAAGDPVTIVSCDANQWCRISAPANGWVWGEDLSK